MPRASSHRILTLVGEALARREGAFYDRLAEGLREALVDGRLPTGTRLPSERDLTDRLGVSRTTVSRAYAELREQGYERASAANVVDAFEKPEDLMKVIHDFIHRCGDEVK